MVVCVLPHSVLPVVQERGFVASSTKGAGAKSSGFTGQSVDKVAAGGAGK